MLILTVIKVKSESAIVDIETDYLRRIYKQCYGCDLLDTEGSDLHTGQRDPEFTSTYFGLKARQGGGGARSHNDKAPFLNAMNTAAHWMIAEKIWPSMSTIL